MEKLTQTYKLFIGNEFVNSIDGTSFGVTNPASGQEFARVALAQRQDAKAAIDEAREAFDKGTWGKTTPADRQALLLKIAEFAEKELLALARLETMETGKPIKMSRDADIASGIQNIRFFAGMSRILDGIASTEYVTDGTSIIRREPIGVVACLVPWNYPWWMAITECMPALAAGNAVVIKPATVTPLTTLELARHVKQAGFPKGAVNVVCGPGNTVGEELASNQKVDMVTLTGDVETGKRIIELASKTIKRTHMELGGKAPFIVCNDADLEAAAQGAVVGGFFNVGQECGAAARIYVQESIYCKFLKRVSEIAKMIRIGDPLVETTDMGPLISNQQRSKVERMVAKGLEQGAKLVIGGKKPEDARLRQGFYYEPTILDGCHQDMEVMRKEIFGPVLPFCEFEEFDDALELANDSTYGLASSIWTKDIQKAMNGARKIRSGTVWLNDHFPIQPETPWGGMKQSGYGKAFSKYSFEAYTEIKHVYVDLTGLARKGWHYLVYGDLLASEDNPKGLG